ncbi:ABC-2 family transporter protein [Candidatus Gottesmanbacteria bacterium]|nr:ABC-2 family transporter protein [Candidatus Gottesmanbacteria bacterium]
MRKYLLVAKNTWDEYMQYRLNFVMWRVRNVLRLIIVYFLWYAIFNQRGELFGYNESQILTYILLSSIVASIVFSTKTQDIGEEINSGNLSNLLIKPISVFKYWMARDLGDKLLNIAFSIVEVFVLIIFFKPPLFFQTNPIFIFLFILGIGFSLAIYFLISILIGFFGFWTPDVWGPRFLFYIFLEFFAGSLFPLDILPKPVFSTLQLLPFNYLLYFPVKIYLGQLSILSIFEGFFVGLVWIIVLYLFTNKVWFKGLKSYGAYGR